MAIISKEVPHFTVNKRAALAGGVVLAVAGAIAGIHGRGEEKPVSAPNTGTSISRQIDNPPANTRNEIVTNLKKIPDFEGRTLDGTLRFSDYRGKPVVIYYFGDIYSKGETQTLEEMRQITKTVQENKDVTLITIVSSKQEALRLKDITSPVIMDDTTKDQKTGEFRSRLLELLEPTGLRAWPVTLFINSSGETALMHLGTIPADELQAGINRISTPQPR